MTTLKQVQLETELLFNTIPQSLPLEKQNKYSNWDRKPFESDSWIFGGTENDVDDITYDLFDSMDASLPDKYYSQQIHKRLAKTYPLHFGDIGGDSLNKKFSGEKSNVVHRGKMTTQTSRQLKRQIFEDCTFSNGSVRVPQQTQSGAVSIPSHLRIENIAKFAKVPLKWADVLARIYCELGLSFKDVIKFNKAIRRRTVKFPWDIKINKDGLTLLQCAEELKALRTADQESPDWTEYDDGIFQFQMIDDLGAHEIDELDLSEEVDPLASKPSEYTYWNQSTIQLSDSPKGKKTYSKFRKIITAIWNETVSKENLPKITKYAKKRLTKSQRQEIHSAIRTRYAI